MPKDLRTYIDLLDEHRELVHVDKEVDPDNNIGTLCHLAQERAIWMKNIKGHPGWTALAQAPANWRHLAMAMGVKQEELVFHVAGLLSAAPTDPVFLNGEPAPCQETIYSGDDADIGILPAHLQSREDGGKCISASICICRDPDTGKYNLSYHRMMPLGKRETGFLMLPRHMWRVYRKYEEKGRSMPIAAIIGHHPGFALAGGISGTEEIDEIRLAGTFLGEPVRMVKARSIDLEVPADAEIIVEGEIPPDTRKAEGPFGEFQGYYLTGETNSPVFHVKTITMRRDAIYKIVQSAYNTEAGHLPPRPHGGESLEPSQAERGDDTDSQHQCIADELHGGGPDDAQLRRTGQERPHVRPFGRLPSTIRSPSAWMKTWIRLIWMKSSSPSPPGSIPPWTLSPSRGYATIPWTPPSLVWSLSEITRARSRASGPR